MQDQTKIHKEKIVANALLTIAGLAFTARILLATKVFAVSGMLATALNVLPAILAAGFLALAVYNLAQGITTGDPGAYIKFAAYTVASLICTALAVGAFFFPALGLAAIIVSGVGIAISSILAYFNNSKKWASGYKNNLSILEQAAMRPRAVSFVPEHMKTIPATANREEQFQALLTTLSGISKNGSKTALCLGVINRYDLNQSHKDHLISSPEKLEKLLRILSNNLYTPKEGIKVGTDLNSPECQSCRDVIKKLAEYQEYFTHTFDDIIPRLLALFPENERGHLSKEWSTKEEKEEPDSGPNPLTQI